MKITIITTKTGITMKPNSNNFIHLWRTNPRIPQFYIFHFTFFILSALSGQENPPKCGQNLFYAKRTQFPEDCVNVKCSYSGDLQRIHLLAISKNEPNRTQSQPNTNPKTNPNQAPNCQKNVPANYCPAHKIPGNKHFLSLPLAVIIS